MLISCQNFKINNKKVWLETHTKSKKYFCWGLQRGPTMSYFGIDRIFRFYKTMKEHGGIMASLYKLYRMDSLRPGTLVGTDKYGNKYFENPSYFYGRNRWIEYAPYYGLEYDGSQVPAEWFGWLHYKTDYLPSEDPGRPNYKWMLDHTENFSGTPGQYMPYTTTKPKIEAWAPPSASK